MVALQILSALWSFLTSRVGILIVAASVAFFAGDRFGTHRIEARALRAQVAGLQHEVEANRRIAETSAQRERQAAQLADDRLQRVAAYERELADLRSRPPEVVEKPVPGAPVIVREPTPAPVDCSLDQHDIERLRDIAGPGQPDPRPRRPLDLRRAGRPS